MVNRTFWQDRVEASWRRRSIVWLSGVRRAGKTCLAQSLDRMVYFDCELPSVRSQMRDPEEFWRGLRGKRVALDEVHRLPNPSETLKIAADHYPTVRVLATGSSTLGASRKFRDTLTGRKENLWLTPMSLADLQDFGRTEIQHRLLRGGLPPFFQARTIVETGFQDWMDSYWARDIQELFRLGRRDSFQRLFELIQIASGGIFVANDFARDCEANRQTIINYLRVLEGTHVVHIVRPFHGRRSTEIVAAPRVYSFDTGFVCYYRGWHSLRDQDLGVLWEHFVLNEIHAATQSQAVRYWRDKRGHEIDFIWLPRGKDPIAIECKWTAESFDPGNLKIFRRQHPDGQNLVVAHDVDRPFRRKFGDVAVRFVGLAELARTLTAAE